MIGKMGWNSRVQFGIILAAILLAISLIVATFAIQSKRQEKEIGEYVVETIIEEQIEHANRGGKLPTGSIYIQYSAKYFYSAKDFPLDFGIHFDELNSTPYLSAWIYDGDKIREAEKQEFFEAIAQDEGQISFAVRSIHEEEAFVDVIADYKSSPGGNASHWTLKLEGKQWMVTERNYFFYWD